MEIQDLFDIQSAILQWGSIDLPRYVNTRMPGNGKLSYRPRTKPWEGDR